MALPEGALRLKMLLCSRTLYKFASFSGARSLSSQHVPSQSVTTKPPEIAEDHLIYTQEHFALKKALRKVCRSANILVLSQLPKEEVTSQGSETSVIVLDVSLEYFIS
ncbi:hypothetical protein ILYODFUR_028452 [Ilyodon furcidens]|uniref:Uncharacterized protein n=1 Tax=Ilyodon furcidens TaxID=33524 RepID=A0ABV0TBT1_9TELE